MTVPSPMKPARGISREMASPVTKSHEPANSGFGCREVLGVFYFGGGVTAWGLGKFRVWEG